MVFSLVSVIFIGDLFSRLLQVTSLLRRVTHQMHSIVLIVSDVTIIIVGRGSFGCLYRAQLTNIAFKN